jgi:hypothetical protein
MLLLNRKIKISLHGMDDKAAKMFGMFLKMHFSSGFEIVYQGQQDIAVVDLDGVHGEVVWSKLRQEFTGPALVLSVHEKVAPNTVWVPKPITSQFKFSLKSVLSLLDEPGTPASDIESSSLPERKKTFDETSNPNPIIGTQSGLPAQIPKTTINPVAETTALVKMVYLSERNYSNQLADESYLRQDSAIFYNPNHYFQALMAQGIAKSLTEKTPVRMMCCDTIIKLDAVHDELSSTCTIKFLRSMAIMVMDGRPSEIHAISTENFASSKERLATDSQLKKLSTAMWELTIWTARGRVPEGTQVLAPVGLKSWPNLTRLPLTPRMLEIIALWVTSPTNLLRTAERLRAPYAEVFSVYSACHGLGLVYDDIWAPAIDDHAVGLPAPTSLAKKSGMLSRLLSKLSLLTH